MRIFRAAIVVAAAAAAVPAYAGLPIPQEIECPVGGKSFTHTTTGSYST